MRNCTNGFLDENILKIEVEAPFEKYKQHALIKQ
jgi:hypothetical protein